MVDDFRNSLLDQISSHEKTFLTNNDLQRLLNWVGTQLPFRIANDSFILNKENRYVTNHTVDNAWYGIWKNNKFGFTYSVDFVLHTYPFPSIANFDHVFSNYTEVRETMENSWNDLIDQLNISDQILCASILYCLMLENQMDQDDKFTTIQVKNILHSVLSIDGLKQFWLQQLKQLERGFVTYDNCLASLIVFDEELTS